MTKIFDEVLGKEEEVHEFVKGSVGKKLVLKDPDDFAEIFKNNVKEQEDEQ